MFVGAVVEAVGAPDAAADAEAMAAAIAADFRFFCGVIGRRRFGFGDSVDRVMRKARHTGGGGEKRVKKERSVMIRERAGLEICGLHPSTDCHRFGTQKCTAQSALGRGTNVRGHRESPSDNLPARVTRTSNRRATQAHVWRLLTTYRMSDGSPRRQELRAFRKPFAAPPAVSCDQTPLLPGGLRAWVMVDATEKTHSRFSFVQQFLHKQNSAVYSFTEHLRRVLEILLASLSQLVSSR